MTSGMNMVYPVRDLEAAKVLYGSLFGVEPHTDQPYYVGFNVNGLEIGLDPNGHAQGMTTGTGYWQVEDIEASVRELVAAGAEALQPVKGVGGGTLTATVKDLDGNVLGLICLAKTSK